MPRTRYLIYSSSKTLHSTEFYPFPLTEFFLKNIPGLQIGQSTFARGMEKFGKVLLFTEHDGKGLHVGVVVVAVVSSLDFDPPRDF